MGRFYERWQALEKRVRRNRQSRASCWWAVAQGSVELALAMRHRLGDAADIGLICGDSIAARLQPGPREAVRRNCEGCVASTLLENCRVTAVTAAG